MQHFKVIGCGGIGGALIPHLARFNWYQYSTNSQLWLVDGDIFEDRNRSRQAFRDRGNKAEATAMNLRMDFPEMPIKSIPYYVTSSNISDIIKENDIVFSCVDNHDSRRLLSKHCRDLSDVLLISGGNETLDGNIQVYRRRGGQDLTLPLDSSFHPEIISPADRNPGDHGCGIDATATPQLLFMNLMIASLMLNAYYAIKHLDTDQANYDEVYASMTDNNTRPVYRTNPTTDKSLQADEIMAALRNRR